MLTPHFLGWADKRMHQFLAQDRPERIDLRLEVVPSEFVFASTDTAYLDRSILSDPSCSTAEVV
eukprot:5094056-Pyramimonas_sp.AAC.1